MESVMFHQFFLYQLESQRANVKVVIADGFQTRAAVCKIATEAVCKANGI